MRMNRAKKSPVTHEGGKASDIKPEQQLRRSVLSCLLWEDEFYEDGQTVADRICEYVKKVEPSVVHALAIEARQKYNLRHVPLLLLATSPNADAIYNTISRADELSELLAIYWRNGKKPIPAQMKKGLAKAFTKFDEYALAKYNRDGAIKLRDVLFMVHARPMDQKQADLWKRLVDGKLETPDTWEVSLSGGGDKKETFERLLRDKKLGYLALLRNLRNMAESNVDVSLIKQALQERKGAERVLPFRYVAAARAVPQFEPMIDEAMAHSISALPKLKGRTVVLVDVSGSMDDKLSAKSDLKRIDAAGALSSIVSSDELRVFTFSDNIVEIPSRKGMSGIDAVIRSQPHRCTNLRLALKWLNQNVSYDRIIVITDEQSNDGFWDPLQGAKGYLINVASAKNGVVYGRWVHIDGFSENVIRYIYETET